MSRYGLEKEEFNDIYNEGFDACYTDEVLPLEYEITRLKETNNLLIDNLRAYKEKEGTECLRENTGVAAS